MAPAQLVKALPNIRSQVNESGNKQSKSSSSSRLRRGTSSKKTYPVDSTEQEDHKKHTGQDRQSKLRSFYRKKSSMAPNSKNSQLRIDTNVAEAEYEARKRSTIEKSSSTPTTAPSTTSSSDSKSSRKVRSNSDLRSPGIKATPNVVSKFKFAEKPQSKESAPIPDFITQTDRYGKASTPRSSAAIVSAKASHDADDKRDDNVEVPQRSAEGHEVDHCESILESLRLMCCCIVVEDERQGLCSTKVTKQSKPVKKSNRTLKTKSSTLQTMSSDVTERVKLLPKIHPDDAGKKCLVLDLDETLVHSSFRAVPGADFVIPVQIEDVVHFVYVAKRPGVDEFLVDMAKHYEIVIYTASLNKYADPLLDLLDPHRVIRARLFRESCVYYEGSYVKDLSLLDRDITQTIIVDNSPASYLFHPENAIDCSSFIDDPTDIELDQIGEFLIGIKKVSDVRAVCNSWKCWPTLIEDASEDDR